MSHDLSAPQDPDALVERALRTVERLRRVTDAPAAADPDEEGDAGWALHRLAASLERCERATALLRGEVQAVHDRLERAEAQLAEAVREVASRGEALHLALLADVERLVARLEAST